MDFHGKHAEQLW